MLSITARPNFTRTLGSTVMLGIVYFSLYQRLPMRLLTLRSRRTTPRPRRWMRVRINVIANDRDRDGRIVPSTVRIVTKPKHGKVTNRRDGTVTYSPALGFQVANRLRYRVKDNDGATSNAARVRITVESGNGLPMADAGPDFNVATGALVTFDGSNSSDPDGDRLTFSWQFLSVPPASTVTNASASKFGRGCP